MKKLLAPILLAAAACVLAALCLWQVMALKSQLDTLDRRLSEQLSSLEDDIYRIPDQMNEALQTQASLLNSYDIQYGDPDYETGTIPLTFTAVPKEWTAGLTTASLVCDGTSYPMTAQETGGFSVTLTLPLLQETELQQVVFTEGDTQRTEPLDFQEAAGIEQLPLFTATLSYSCNYSKGQVFFQDVMLEILPYFLPTDRSDWDTMSLFATVDGKEIDRIPLDLDDFQSGGDNWWLQTQQEYTYSLPQGSTLSLSLEATHVSGLRCVTPLTEVTAQEDGTLEEEDWTGSSNLTLYSPKGKLLWSGSPYEIN